MKKRILVADDNEDTALVFRQGLEWYGYEVTVATDGLKAEEMAISQLPDLIVMDIMMPEMDGLQAASRIRKNPKTHGIPILAVTGRVVPGDREKCLAGGFDGYIAKPFTLRDLKAAIEVLFKDHGQ